jgi:heterodisulfide reductase subunit C
MSCLLPSLLLPAQMKAQRRLMAAMQRRRKWMWLCRRCHRCRHRAAAAATS